jgi:hypothetical protein
MHLDGRRSPRWQAHIEMSGVDRRRPRGQGPGIAHISRCQAYIEMLHAHNVEIWSPHHGVVAPPGNNMGVILGSWEIENCANALVGVAAIPTSARRLSPIACAGDCCKGLSKSELIGPDPYPGSQIFMHVRLVTLITPNHIRSLAGGFAESGGPILPV